MTKNSNFSKFADKALSRTEMRSIAGGNICYATCIQSNGAKSLSGPTSKSAAQGGALSCAESGGRGFWCCASC